jgi:integrase/recombinase XerC
LKTTEAIERFHTYIATERRMAAGTVRNYIDDLEDFDAWLRSQDIEVLDDVTAREVRGWQMEHMERGEKAGTVKRRLSSLSSFFRYLRRHGLFEADIMAKVSAPKQPKRLPVFFKEKETEHLYDEGLFPDTFMGQRDKLMLRMLYETGMRRSELAGLKTASVDFSSLTIKVLGKRNKERLIPIENELAHNIKEYLALKEQEKGPSEWLFVGARGRQITPQDVYLTVKKYMTALSDADRISPHVFRHSFATHILNEGGNIEAIKELLGHADLATTEVYTHVTREHLKEVYKHAHPRGKVKS